MFKNLKDRLPRSLSCSRSRKAVVAPPEAQNSEPTTTAITVEKAPAPYLPAPRRKTSTLFELEALLSSIIDSHHHCGQDARAVVERGEKAREGSGGRGGGGGALPSYEELYKELEREKYDVEPQVPEISGFMTVQSVPHLSLSQQPILRRKPKGLVGHKRSTREKALEALMRLLDRCEDDEEEEEERVKRARRFPSVENMGAVRRRALEGLRRRGWDVTVISGSKRRDG